MKGSIYFTFIMHKNILNLNIWDCERGLDLYTVFYVVLCVSVILSTYSGTLLPEENYTVYIYIYIIFFLPLILWPL